MTQPPVTSGSDEFKPNQEQGPEVGRTGRGSARDLVRPTGVRLQRSAVVGAAKREGEGEGAVKSLSLAKCVAQRLRVSEMSEGRLSVQLGSDGMVCLGIGSHEGMPPVLVLYDEIARAGSIPVEMTLKELLPFLSSAWLGLFEVSKSTVVVRTREGYWDLAFVSWSHEQRVRGFSLVPITWIECKCRSEEAFAKAFGDQARRAHHIMFRMRAAKLGAIGT